MKILVLGGTRFVGRSVARRLVNVGHEVVVSSRRPELAPAGVGVLGGERSIVLDELALKRERWDAVLDFTAYDGAAVSRALEVLNPASYLLISSAWVPRLSPGALIDEPVTPPSVPPIWLPEVTQRYLLGKADAEMVVLDARQRGRPAALLRLPILAGVDDPTGRIDFYRRRVRDGAPMLLVNGGHNSASLAWGEDVAHVLAQALADGILFSQPLLDGIAGTPVPVREILAKIAAAEGFTPETQSFAEDHIAAGLKDFLDHEPLWRERGERPGRGNLFQLTACQPRPIGEWLRLLVRHGVPRPESGGLRARELRWLHQIEYHERTVHRPLS